MLDINLIREDPKAVESDLEKRGMQDKLGWVKQVSDADKAWRELKKQSDDLRMLRNQATERIKQAKNTKEDIAQLIQEAKTYPQKIKDIEAQMIDLQQNIEHHLMRFPNILHESVPVGASEKDNVVVTTWGVKRSHDFELKHHGQIAVDLGLADFERAVKISGAGFYFLKGDLALLDMALQNFAVNMLVEDGYTLICPPFMMRRSPYEGVTDLEDFENVMYKVEGEDLYMIATSEHPMAAMYQGEIIDSKDLPIRYAGLSSCFRREIGAHGLDERGLFRVHQFNKIEQFIFCDPKDSWNHHEVLIKNAERLMQALELPYRVVNVCTGDIGTVAAKKYDLEGYSPREDKYIELMSCSNCTSYQAARLKIRMKTPEGNQHLHTLNSTMVATSRALRLILENYQQSDGTVSIPKVLQPLMGGKTKLSSLRSV